MKKREKYKLNWAALLLAAALARADEIAAESGLDFPRLLTLEGAEFGDNGALRDIYPAFAPETTTYFIANARPRDSVRKLWGTVASGAGVRFNGESVAVSGGAFTFDVPFRTTESMSALVLTGGRTGLSTTYLFCSATSQTRGSSIDDIHVCDADGREKEETIGKITAKGTVLQLTTYERTVRIGFTGTACAALGIDPHTDSRFVKNGKPAVDALPGFYDSALRAFHHVQKDNGTGGMATNQAAYAMTAYQRLARGQNSLYNMGDVRRDCADGNHVFGEVRETEVTCTMPKLRTYTCTVCGRSKYEVLSPALGHRTASGYSISDRAHWFTCAVCGAHVSEGTHKYIGDQCTVCGYHKLGGRIQVTELTAVPASLQGIDSFSTLVRLQSAMLAKLQKVDKDITRSTYTVLDVSFLVPDAAGGCADDSHMTLWVSAAVLSAVAAAVVIGKNAKRNKAETVWKEIGRKRWWPHCWRRPWWRRWCWWAAGCPGIRRPTRRGRRRSSGTTQKPTRPRRRIPTTPLW